MKTVSKVDAARRLLRSAIIMHLRDDEPLAVHLAAQSAFRICRDIVKREARASDLIEQRIRPEKLSEFLRKFSALNNFIKHAERDAGDFEFPAEPKELNQALLMLAVIYYFSIPQCLPDCWITGYNHFILIKDPQYRASPGGSPGVMALFKHLDQFNADDIEREMKLCANDVSLAARIEQAFGEAIRQRSA